MNEPQRSKWGFFTAMRSGIRELFPTRKTKTAMWGVVGLGVLITYMELGAAQLFSTMITDIDARSTGEAMVLFAGFLLTFAAIRGISYFQSVYRLTVFEKSFRKLHTGSLAAEAWRWPMAISLVGIIGQLARLGAITMTVFGVSRMFGGLLLVCSAFAVLIVNRTGTGQYDIHHQFEHARKAGTPTSAAVRIGTRIKAGERGGLLAVVPILVYVAVLGYEAADGNVTTSSALVLFIAGRMAANNYGGLSNETMRYIRAQVNVESYGGGAKPAREAGAVEASTDAAETTAEAALDHLPSDEYLWDPPPQVFARLADEGVYVGDPTVLGQIARDAGFGPDRELRKSAPQPRPDPTVATEPNQTWLYGTYRLPVAGASPAPALQVLIDGFSRKVVRWNIHAEEVAVDATGFFEAACGDAGVAPEAIDLRPDAALIGTDLNLYDFLKTLGVIRTLIWAGPTPEIKPRPGNRPAFPTVFETPGEAETWLLEFVDWYNDGFYQPDVGYLHPSDVHAGNADAILSSRRDVLNRVLGIEGNTYPGGLPDSWRPPIEAWIDPVSITTIASPIPEPDDRAIAEDEEY